MRRGARQRANRLCPREVMTLLIHFQRMRFRDLKTYDTRYVAVHLRAEFPAWSAIRALSS